MQAGTVGFVNSAFRWASYLPRSDMVSSSGWRAPLIVHVFYIGLLVFLGLWVTEFVVLGLILLAGVLFLRFRPTSQPAAGDSEPPTESRPTGEALAADEVSPADDQPLDVPLIRASWFAPHRWAPLRARPTPSR